VRRDPLMDIERPLWFAPLVPRYTEMVPDRFKDFWKVTRFHTT
jgi:hypothetical protein